jgi:hypothetical protein
VPASGISGDSMNVGEVFSHFTRVQNRVAVADSKDLEWAHDTFGTTVGVVLPVGVVASFTFGQETLQLNHLFRYECPYGVRLVQLDPTDRTLRPVGAVDSGDHLLMTFLAEEVSVGTLEYSWARHRCVMADNTV